VNTKLLIIIAIIVLTLAAIPAVLVLLMERNLGAATGIFLPVAILSATLLGVPLYVIVNRGQQARKNPPPDPLTPEQHLQVTKTIPNLLFAWGGIGAAGAILDIANVEPRTALFWTLDLLSSLVVIGLGFLVRRRSVAGLIAAAVVIGLNHALGIYRGLLATGAGWPVSIMAVFAVVVVSILVQAIRSFQVVNQSDPTPEA
jgi:hypothetical protein